MENERKQQRDKTECNFLFLYGKMEVIHSYTRIPLLISLHVNPVVETSYVRLIPDISTVIAMIIPDFVSSTIQRQFVSIVTPRSKVGARTS